MLSRMGRLEGTVALISGGARGQDVPMVLMAEEGADIITLDLCRQVESGRVPDGYS